MNPSDHPELPLVASSLFNGLRAQLIAQGRWERLEQAILDCEPTLQAWLLATERDAWAPLLPYFDVMACLEGELGREGMFELGAERLRADLETGSLAPMLRAWTREFSNDPSTLMRVSPHVWSAITQHAGVMRLTEAEPNRVVFRVGGAPPELLGAVGWHHLFEGFGTELMRRSGRQGSVSVSADSAAGELVLAADWP